MQAVFNKLKQSPYLLLVLATFFWGTNFAFSRMVIEEIPPIQLSVIRWLIVSIVFLPFVINEVKANKAILKANWKVLILLAITGVGGFNTLLYIAIQYTTSINASLVNSLSPLLIVVLSVMFLKERIVPWQFVGIVVSLAGVVVVVTGGSMEAIVALRINPGDVIVVAAVICWSIYSVLMKRFGVDLPKKATFLITIYIAIACLIPFALFERTYEPLELTSLSPSLMLTVVYLALFPGFLSFICWNEGVMQVGPGRASNYLHMIVLFTTVLAVLFTGESLAKAQLIGGILILTGVILASNPQFLSRKGKAERRAVS
ncbi:DMT family transporter [Halalkalibacter oceani]|uniref:DMT family transporter n=1 Tax=Halalkalibacter oceani TaxID=1653776 RepID=A0A9X2DNZ6_9BACI|nr:DMT family transporter [Halalkalibacter oceani]MCM3713335.1 DMT family transporter [Halalkalibacter oceani]